MTFLSTHLPYKLSSLSVRKHGLPAKLMCLCGTWFYVRWFGSCGLEKIRTFQVTSALTWLLTLTCSVGLDRLLCIYWNNWV